MSSQPTLFDAPADALQKEIAAEARKPWSRYDAGDPCASRHRGSETSEDAYAAIRETASESRARVYRFIQNAGEFGATTDEIALAFGWTPNMVSPRVSELLYRERRVEKNGKRRNTASGHSAAVVVAKRFA